MSVSEIMDAIALWVIVLQGFFICYFEWDVWRIHRHRFEERAQWREAKRKQVVKKTEKGINENEQAS